MLILSALAGFVTMQWLMALSSIGILALIYAVELFEWRYGIFFPMELKAFYAVFMYLSLFLGGHLGFYRRFDWWDTPLHFISGVGLGVLGFLLLYAYYRRGKLQLPPFAIAGLSFCFAVSIGMAWEIFEFASDQLVGTTMQPNNFDTMVDIIANSLGALVSSVAGFSYLRGRKIKPLHRLIGKFLLANPDLARNVDMPRGKA